MSAKSKPKPLTRHERFLPDAEEAARKLVRSWIDYGPKELNHFAPERMPSGALMEVASGVLDAKIRDGVKDYGGIVASFTAAPQPVKDELAECYQAFSPLPSDCGPLLDHLDRYDRTRRREILAHQLATSLAADASDENDHTTQILQQIAELEVGSAGKAHSLIVHGVNSYPTTVPPETVILGNGLLRWADIAHLISTAGAGKSVAAIQMAMAWALGLSYFGICPPRPLRILLFSGEDDSVTMGQCREGFLEHSQDITGRKLTLADLAPLDFMLRTEFSREHVGDSFHIHLVRLLRESPADLVIINPLLSYLGGEVVATVSTWLRAGLMPILQKNNCAAVIAHHTGKMAKDGWDNTDDTYSAIGGGEVANVPRTILTLRPTAADGLFVVKVSKRQTTGWKDADGNFTTSYFVKRSGNPERPAWIPVDSCEAQERMYAGKPSGSAGKGGKKVTAGHVIEALETGPMQRQGLIDWLTKRRTCSGRTASDAILEAEKDEVILSFTETNPNGGKAIKWLSLPQHRGQWEK